MTHKYDAIKDFLKMEALKPESRRKMPTIRELMRRFQASQSPVSRAIRDLEAEGVLICGRGAGIVSCSNAQQPDPLPKGLRNAPNGNVLFVYVDYFAENIWNIQHTINAYALQLGINSINFRIQQGDDLILIIRDIQSKQELCGIILLMEADCIPQAALDQLGNLNIPVVLLDNQFDYPEYGENISLLAADFYSCGQTCAAALFQAGHRRIGYIRNEPESSATQQRHNGIIDFCHDHLLELYSFSTAIKSWDNALAAACKVTAENLDRIKESRLTGLIYTSSQGAFAAMSTLLRNGFRLPEDLSLLGSGDSTIIRYAYPSLSVAVTDYLQMSRDALEIAIGIMPRQAYKTYAYKMEIRESIRILQPELVTR